MKTKNQFLSISEAVKRANDGQNQDIKSKFVGREVFCNVNSLAEYVLSKGYEDQSAPFTIDDIENMYSYNVDVVIEKALELWEEKSDEFKAYANDPDTFNRRMKKEGDLSVFIHSLDSDELSDFIREFDIEVESEPAEIYEWWAVSSWLFDKLKEKGCTVVDSGSCKIWGRQTTGQAILLDGVISRICADLEILEGQANSWANGKA